MSYVLGSNFTLYSGDGLRALGCEESCTLRITTEDIITTTKGSGNATNRVDGRYDWSVTSNGVVSINAVFDGSGTNLDPTEFMAYQLQGNKVVVKFLFTDGTTSKWVIGTGVVTSSTYAGSAGDFMTYDIEIKGDGKLYTSQSLVSNVYYDGPTTYIYTATGSVLGFVVPSLYNAEINGLIYYVVVTTASGTVTYLSSEIETLITSGSTPTGAIGLHSATGTLNFNPNLASTNTVMVVYDIGNPF